MTKVLYVEDHEAQRDIMGQMLALYGYDLAFASDGEEGVKKAKEWQPDVVLMDIRLPGPIDGLVAIRQLRDDPDTADIPIIVISAWGSLKHKERALKAGADVHFTKPVTMDELIAAINRHLRDSPPRRGAIQEVTRRADIQQSREIPAERKLSVNKVLDSLSFWMRSWISPRKDRPSQDTLAALGRAFASTEHDLVGMLSNIQSTVELMLSSSPKREQVKRIWRASRHCLLMVKNFAELRPGGSLELKPLDIVEIVEEVVDLMQPELKGKVNVVLESDRDLPLVVADPMRVEQVLVNLIKNSRDAAADTITIKISSSQTNGELRIDIIDTGCGIPEAHHARIFTPWFSTKVQEGRGLGLYIVKTIIDRHGWLIQFKSKPSEGTTFSITVPPENLTQVPRPDLSSQRLHALITSRPRVLLVDDNDDSLSMYQEGLRGVDYDIRTARTVDQALHLLEAEPFDTVVTDLKFLGEEGEEGMAGFRIFKTAGSASPPIQVIVVTGYGTESIAQRVMQLGAFAYISKPLNWDQFRLSIQSAIEARRRLALQEQEEPKPGDIPYQATAIIGNSDAMTEVIEQVEIAARSSESVLIRGEGGTGKSFVAETIHVASRRRDKPFVVVNCVQLSTEPLELVKSRWFGKKLAGSDREKPGVFEQANGGTLFLDGIDELSDEIQRQLVDVIEKSEITPVGSDYSISIDIRFISSVSEKADSKLRGDLYRRLAKLEIHLPPLRDRIDDIPALAGHFLRKYCFEYGLQVELSEDALLLLQQYSFPQNVVELENIMRLAVVRAKGGTILPEQLPRKVRDFTPEDRDRSRIESLRRQLTRYRKNLYALEERKALYGPGEVPLSLSNEIDLVQEKIDTLSEELGKME